MTTLSTSIIPERIAALETRVQREIDEGLLPAAQYAIAINGELVKQETYGDATNDTRFCVFSSTKAFTVSAFWILLAETDVSITDRVADYLPEWSENDKGDITIEQVMLHTAGFPYGIMGSPHWRTHDSRLNVYPRWKLTFEPGKRFIYHATSAHWVLMDILTTVTGVDHREFLRDRVIDPIGLKHFALGIPADEQTNLAEIVYTGEAMTPDELEAVFGFREIPAPRGSLAAMGDFGTSLNGTEDREVGIPGGGGFSTAGDVALFYQALLRNDQGIWDPEVLADGTQRVRCNLRDPLYGVDANRALGTIIAGGEGANLRGFGKTFGPRAFGHGGAGGQIAIGDPDTGVSFSYLTNGHDRHTIRQGRRGVALASLAGLVTAPS